MNTQEANLQDCHRALVADADKNGWACPSLITMRRHARAGLLKPCISKSGEGTGRTLYDVNLVLSHYLVLKNNGDPNFRRQGSIEPRSLNTLMLAPSASPADTDEGAIALNKLLQKVIIQFDSLRARSEKMEAQISEMHAALADLSWARKNLMSKYDAAYAAAVERANRLEMAGASTIRPEASTGLGQLEMARLQNDVKVIKNTVQDLVGRLQDL